MPADRLLGTLLRSLQTHADQQDTPRLLGTAASLLTTLNNPLNVTLLTSQLLSAPAIWTWPDGLLTCMRCMSVFHSAATALLRFEDAANYSTRVDVAGQPRLERTIPKEDWIRAVVKGADERSPRWRHLLVLAGLLIGFGSPEDEGMSRSMRATLERAFVTAANLTLGDTIATDELGELTAVLSLNHAFPVLSDSERSQINFDILLPILVRSTLYSSEGLGSAYFLGTMDLDLRQVAAQHFEWATASASYHRVQAVLSSPLISSLGPLSRLISHAIQHVRNPSLVIAAVDDIQDFARTLHMQWRHNKLSEVDSSEEEEYVHSETLQTTLPTLWKLLRSTLFALSVVLRGVVGRMLGDSALAGDEVAPKLATQTLNTLRNLYFISSRFGSEAFSQYTFVYLTAIDTLVAYPPQAQDFLQSIAPSDAAQIPAHPLDRNLDLFFLNTAEHFTLNLPQEVCENVLAAAAAPYLLPGGSNTLLPIFEAAHSVMLAVFSAPHNAGLTERHLPLYVDALFGAFPASLSSLQFRLAFKTLLTIASPPSQLSVSQHLLAATLLEMLHERAVHASTSLLPPPATANLAHAASESLPPLSEQAVLTLALFDTLPSLSLELLDEWLPICANMLNAIADQVMHECCRDHLWHVLENGEMDAERSRICVAWWTTRGGREAVLYRRKVQGEQQYEMSGALPNEALESKL